MKRHVPLVVALLSVACGNEPTSPSSLPQSPSFPPQAPPGAPLTMRGGCGIRRICRFQARRCRPLRQAVALSPWRTERGISPAVAIWGHRIDWTFARNAERGRRVRRDVLLLPGRSGCFLWNPISLSCSADDMPVCQSLAGLDAPL